MHETSERRTRGKARIALAALVLVGVAAGGLKLASHESKLDTQVLGASAKKPPVAPTITSSPADSTNSQSATFAFKTTPTPAGYLCKLDGGSFSACSSPKTYAGPLAAGGHTFQVEAQDAGFTSTPTIRTWAVDLTLPVAPTFTKTPEDPTFETKAQFNYRDSEAGVTFECALDAAAAVVCGPAGIEYKNVAVGAHTFTVWAVDAAGNRSPARFTWTILENKSFGISGNAVGQLSPGVTVPVNLTLTNPYNFSIRVTGITVKATAAVKGSHQPPVCSAQTDVSTKSLTTPPPPSPPQAPTLDIPANSSRTLSSYLPGNPAGTPWELGDPWPTTWPTITMIDTDANQDDCKNTTFTLSYTGTAQKS